MVGRHQRGGRPVAIAPASSIGRCNDATRALPKVFRASATSCGLITPRPTRATPGRGARARR